MIPVEELNDERLDWARRIFELEQRLKEYDREYHNQGTWLSAYRDYVKSNPPTTTTVAFDAQIRYATDDIVREFWSKKGYGLP